MNKSIVVFDVILVSLILFLYSYDLSTLPVSMPPASMPPPGSMPPPVSMPPIPAARRIYVVDELRRLENFNEKDCFKDLSKLKTNESVKLVVSHGMPHKGENPWSHIREKGRVPDNLMELFPNLKSFKIFQGTAFKNFMDFEMDFGIFESNNLKKLYISDKGVFVGVLKDLLQLTHLAIFDSNISGIGHYPELLSCTLRVNHQLRGDAKNFLNSVNENIRVIDITKCPQFFHGDTFQEINFSRFTMLEELVISDNNIECLLPAEMGELPSIKRLEIHGNKFRYNQEFFYNLGQNLGKKTKHPEFIIMNFWDRECSEGFVKCLKDYMNDAERYDEKLLVRTHVSFYNHFDGDLNDNMHKPFWEFIRLQIDKYYKNRAV
ncbi:MAG: hypothetical protein EBS86_13330 [Crocinitomicaceae bacterium]|nr:hypothetical protein [Crocinitomicaceae bacterium]